MDAFLWTEILEPIPTTLISGYLGSGKTTFINRLLNSAEGLRFTVLVNDFGKIAIDEKLIANSDGETLALTNGCMCCSIGGALFDALDRILSLEPRPDHLVIETSGVADPGKIAQIAIAEPEMEYQGCLTLVDANSFFSHLEDKYISDTVVRQVRNAQAIGVTKLDLVRENVKQRLNSEIRSTNQSAPIFKVRSGNLPFEFLTESFVGQRNSAAFQGQGGRAKEHVHGNIYASWSYSGNNACSVETIRRLSNPEISGIYRLKGYLRTDTGDCVLVHRAGSDFQYSLSKDRTDQTQLVAIGIADRFSPEKFEKQWHQASQTDRRMIKAK